MRCAKNRPSRSVHRITLGKCPILVATGGSARMLIRRPRPRADIQSQPTWWDLGDPHVYDTPIKAQVKAPFPPDGTDSRGVRTYIVRRPRPSCHDLSHPNGGPVGDRLVPRANNKPVKAQGPNRPNHRPTRHRISRNTNSNPVPAVPPEKETKEEAIRHPSRPVPIVVPCW